MIRALILSSCIIGAILGHSWLDCTKDTGIGLNTPPSACKGYPRGYPGRVEGVDQIMTYRIQPRISGPNPPICAPTQRTPNYTPAFPMAQAKPGDILRLKYLPNGHQRGAGQKPQNYTIHWTGVPGTQLNNRLDLNDGNRIAGPFPFDAECYCNNCAGNPCYGYLRIPANVAPGTYFFVWYWVFDRDPNGGGEEYTTCFDVQITPTSTRIVQETTTVVVPAEADALVRGGTHAGTPYGNASSACLQVRGGSNLDNVRETFLRFNSSAILSGVESCSLKVMQRPSSASYPVTVSVVNDDSWNEAKINFRNKPASGSVVGQMTEGTASLNLAGIQAAGMDGKLSLRLHDPVPYNLQMNLFSREEGKGPTLECVKSSTIVASTVEKPDLRSTTENVNPAKGSSDSSLLSLSALLLIGLTVFVV